MISSRVVRASDSQCRSRNCPGFNPSILQHSRIWGGGSVEYRKKNPKKSPPFRILIFGMFQIYPIDFFHFCFVILNFGLFQIYPNGGGKVLHAWQEDLDRLSEEENLAFAEEFVTESFRNERQPYN